MKTIIETEDAVGASLFPDPALDRVWAERCEELAKATDRLSAVNAQDAFILLTSMSSFRAPKFLHLLRCSPPVYHNSPAMFDLLLRRSV